MYMYDNSVLYIYIYIYIYIKWLQFRDVEMNMNSIMVISTAPVITFAMYLHN